jgi:hypothetical protein
MSLILMALRLGLLLGRCWVLLGSRLGCLLIRRLFGLLLDRSLRALAGPLYLIVRPRSGPIGFPRNRGAKLRRFLRLS